MREIKLTDITREELWAKQRLSFTDIDYAVWERNKSMLHEPELYICSRRI